MPVFKQCVDLQDFASQTDDQHPRKIRMPHIPGNGIQQDLKTLPAAGTGTPHPMAYGYNAVNIRVLSQGVPSEGIGNES